jgi:allophanate hydrolase
MTALAAARAALDRITAYDAVQPQAWIARFAEDEVLAAAANVDRRLDAGESLPLAGLTFAVKDNIDLAGLSTTAACPAFAYAPETSATVVERLLAAGAVAEQRVERVVVLRVEGRRRHSE